MERTFLYCSRNEERKLKSRSSPDKIIVANVSWIIFVVCSHLITRTDELCRQWWRQLNRHHETTTWSLSYFPNRIIVNTWRVDTNVNGFSLVTSWEYNNNWNSFFIMKRKHHNLNLVFKLQYGLFCLIVLFYWVCWFYVEMKCQWNLILELISILLEIIL